MIIAVGADTETALQPSLLTAIADQLLRKHTDSYCLHEMFCRCCEDEV